MCVCLYVWRGPCKYGQINDWIFFTQINWIILFQMAKKKHKISMDFVQTHNIQYILLPNQNATC